MASPSEVYNAKIIRVNEIESNVAPLNSDGKKPVSMWYLYGTEFTLPGVTQTEITIPAKGTIKAYSTIERFNGNVKKIIQASGTRGLLTSALANIFKTSDRFGVTQVSATKFMRVKKEAVANTNYFIELVEIASDGTETILQDFDTGIIGYTTTTSYSYIGMVKIDTDKYVFIGRNTYSSNDYSSHMVLNVNTTTNTITGGTPLNVRDDGEGDKLFVISPRTNMYVHKGQDNYFKSYTVSGTTITYRSQYTGGSSYNYLTSIGDGYFVAKYSNDTFTVFLVSTAGAFTLKIAKDTNFTQLCYRATHITGKKFFGHYRDATGTYHGIIFEYNTGSNITNIIVDKEIHDVAYTTPGYSMMLDDDTLVFQGSTENGIGFVKNITFNGAFDDFTVDDESVVPVSGNNAFEIKRETDEFARVQYSAYSNDPIKIVSDILDVPQIGVTKTVNGKEFTDAPSLVALDFNSDSLKFEFDFINETGEDVVIPYSTSVYLYLYID